MWRQFCIYYNYYTVELYSNLNVIRYQLGNVESYGQLLLVLAMMVKYKSTYCLSLLSIHVKYFLSLLRERNNKQLDELHKRMKMEHDAYEMIYSEISSKFDAENIGKNVRN